MLKRATTAVRNREERVVFIEIRISNTFIAYAGLIGLSKPAEATAPHGARPAPIPNSSLKVTIVGRSSKGKEPDTFA